MPSHPNSSGQNKQRKFSHADLIPHWLLWAFLSLLLVTYNVVSLIWGKQIQIQFDASDRLVLKSLLYALTIFLFPLVKLIRYILLRLNQTIPINQNLAQQRYFFTLTVTLVLIEVVGGFGFILFILGDELNTLYIFSVLAALGLYLHKPSLPEYLAICRALDTQIEGN
jgi:hypothetical protein